MKHILILLLLALPLAAQLTPRPFDIPRIVEVDPGLIPATASTLTTTTTWVTMITLTNITDAAASCTIADRQSTPRALVGADITIAAKSVWIMSFPEGRKMPSGIIWSCSAGNAIVGYLVGKQQ